MKKYWLSLIAVLAVFSGVCGAEQSFKASAKATVPDKAIVSGKTFNVKLNFTAPGPIEVMGATFFAEASKAPADFATKAKLKYNSKWKTVRIKTVSFPAELRKKTEQNISIVTTGWPAGDYLIWITCFYRKPGTKPYLDCPAKFPLTIVEKDSNEGK